MPHSNRHVWFFTDGLESFMGNSYHIADHMRTSLVTEALDMALARRRRLARRSSPSGTPPTAHT